MGKAFVGVLIVAGLAVRIGLAQGGFTLNPAQVLGPHVTFTWSAVAGASSYVLRAGVTAGQYQVGFNVGNTTTASATAPAVGTYFVRAQALDASGGILAQSNEITVQVVSMVVPPAAPVNLAAYINGTSALITWALGSGGGSPTGLVLHAGTTPGASDIGIFPLTVSTQLIANNVTPRTYYLRLQAVNAGGSSPASNEAQLVMPLGGGCSAPPERTITPLVFGRYVQLRWNSMPGAAFYRLDYTGTFAGSQTFSGATTSATVTAAALGVYNATLTTAFTCGQTTTGPVTTITVDGAPPPGPRTPNPPAGQRLPLPNMFSVIDRLANERRDLLLQSCVEHGGNNRFLFEAVRRLRAIDNRWGLNWKRGLRGDLSQDVVNYNYGSESDEGTRQVYIIDIIAGHCGSNPGPAWIDQTEATRQANSIGVWTLMPYLDAGYPIVSDPMP